MTTIGLGRIHFPWGPDKIDSISCVYEGQEVLAPYDSKRGIKCKVHTAAGYHARAVNENMKFDKWFHVHDLGKQNDR